MQNTTATDSEKRVPHTLDEIVLAEKGRDWKSRLAAWKKPMPYDDRISWLHTNYERDGNGPEQFIFYLELADRYGDEEIFESLPGHANSHLFTLRSYESVASLKSRLSKKAFAMLCTYYFAEQEEQKQQYPYSLPYKDPLFSKLLWFFRSYGGDGGFDNLRPRTTNGLGKNGGEHYVSVTNEFARIFAMDAWKMLVRDPFYWEEDPNPEVADPYWREIVTLMRRLQMLDSIEQGQFITPPSLFKKMLRMVFEESNASFEEKSLDDMTLVGNLLEPLVRKGDVLARTLYIARLNVHDRDHNGPALL